MTCKVGQTVQVFHRNSLTWVTGVVTEVFRGPLSGQMVYVVGNYGYYAHELRPALAVAA